MADDRVQLCPQNLTQETELGDQGCDLTYPCLISNSSRHFEGVCDNFSFLGALYLALEAKPEAQL